MAQAGLDGNVPFSKFEPHREVEEPADAASTPAAARRARVLKWANWIVLGYMLLGFGFIVYWLFRGR